MASRYARMHVLVGAFVLSVLILIALWAAAGRQLLTPSIELVTHLAENTGFTSNTPVSYLGMKVGRVSEVGFDDSGSHPPGRPIIMKLRIAKRHAHRIRADFVATYEADPLGGLLSNKIILRPPEPPKEKGGAQAPPRRIERTIADGDEIAFDVQPALTEYFKDLGRQLADKTFPVIDKVATATDQILAGVAGLIDSLSNPTSDFQTIIRGVRRLMQNVNDPGGPVLGTLETLGRLAEDLERGDGIAGRLLVDRALADDATASVTQLREILTHANAIAEQVRSEAPTLLETSATTMSQIASLTEQAQPLPGQLSGILESTQTALQPFARQASRIEGLLAQLRRDAELAEEIMSALTRHWILRAFISPERKNPPALLAPSLDPGDWNGGGE